MAIYIRKWICEDGSVLFPQNEISISDVSHGALIPSKGKYYIPINEEVVAIQTGNPIGLLLSLTYTV